jgi:hypothetical protein
VPLAQGSIQLIYRTPDGAMKERLLGRGDEASIAIASTERPFSFDGDGAAFQLTCEAKRIDLAFLFDQMVALECSNRNQSGPRSTRRYRLWWAARNAFSGKRVRGYSTRFSCAAPPGPGPLSVRNEV